jgi:signal transduction histidine kinase
MIRSPASLLPASLFARMALILLAGLLAAQSLSLWLHWGERAEVVTEARGLHMADRIADVILRLEADPTPGHRRAIAQIQSGDLRVALIDENEVHPNAPRGQIQATIAARLGSGRDIRSPGGMGSGMMGRGMGPGAGPGTGYGMGSGAGFGTGRMALESAVRTLDVRLNDGQWVRITATLVPDAPALPRNFYMYLLLSLAIVVAVVMLVVRQATRPLQQLAQAADSLGQNLDAPPLVEAGSTEVRTAAQAFNRMRAKLRRLIDERSRALAAVSHDLRTPLTRLRLRSELLDDERLRDQMAADIDAMAQMIDATLDYLRGLRENEPVRPIDINALLASLAEDFAALGRPITVEGLANDSYNGRLSALRRAIQNLMDNAFKYGRNPRIIVSDDETDLRISVEDEGPGIPPEALDRVTEPFYRPDAARASDTGGVGLGLSIVRDVALLHGGELVLANRPQGGLSAELRLPRNFVK